MTSITSLQARVQMLEHLVEEKDAAFEAAVTAKVEGEALLLKQCVLLLNAKKRERATRQETRRVVS
jgi:hypothetical protein